MTKRIEPIPTDVETPIGHEQRKPNSVFPAAPVHEPLTTGQGGKTYAIR
jgi:hypothetical protein